jgi:mannose-6-phosphate isomerase-like protein (cupin superfamily)
MTASTLTLPPDDPSRGLTVARPETDDAALAHVAIAGDTYTILLSGDDTAGRFTLIDMLVPPGGGPLPHRHDFEETFMVLRGEIEVTFRGETSMLRAGQTANIPANAPHFFRNTGERAARLLCTCAPSGLEEFFLAVGDRVSARTSPHPTSTAPRGWPRPQSSRRATAWSCSSNAEISLRAAQTLLTSAAFRRSGSRSRCVA